MDEFITEEKFDEMERTAKEYASAKADRIYLEHYRKSQRAILMQQYALQHPTTAAQEREALADGEYTEILLMLKNATEIEERLKWKLTIFQTRFEQWRTLSANRRAEANMR